MSGVGAYAIFWLCGRVAKSELTLVALIRLQTQISPFHQATVITAGSTDVYLRPNTPSSLYQLAHQAVQGCWGDSSHNVCVPQRSDFPHNTNQKIAAENEAP